MLGQNHELWKGLFQSVVLGWQPYVNVDVANKVFPRALPLIEWVRSFGPLQDSWDRWKDWERKKLAESLTGVRLVYTPPDAPSNKRTYTSQGLCRTADQEYLTDKDGKRTVTVAQYFSQKGCRLNYPNLPCIRTGRPGSAVLPMEFCKVAAGQANNKQAPDDCKQEMIRKTAVSTWDRKRKILELVGDANYTHPVIKQFGIKVSGELAKTAARVLPEPELQYGSSVVTPKSGVWQLRANERFHDARTIKNWSVICMANVYDSVIQTFARTVSSTYYSITAISSF
jgi:eukaryotic translation initiation factor 2C